MIEVGEYGRTNFGKIIKFAWYEKEKEILNDKAVILVDKMRTTTDCFYYFEKGECIVKHSKNIIDLIEVGDIVEIFDVLNEDVIYIWSEEMLKALKEDIKNGIGIRRILTHEQFEANCYKVEEE